MILFFGLCDFVDDLFYLKKPAQENKKLLIP